MLITGNVRLKDYFLEEEIFNMVLIGGETIVMCKCNVYLVADVTVAESASNFGKRSAGRSSSFVELCRR